MKKAMIITAMFFIAVVFGLMLAHGPLNAQGSSMEQEIISKLDEIAKDQKDLMASVNSIKEDLQIIKIRITQMQ